VDRPTLEVADVFRQYGDAYRARAGATLSSLQRRVMTAIEQCRTAALGGHVEACDACGHRRIAYNSAEIDIARSVNPSRGPRGSNGGRPSYWTWNTST
jgi:hypothetical protein